MKKFAIFFVFAIIAASNFSNIPANAYIDARTEQILSQTERKILNRDYYGENELDRLERLELELFGTVQQGSYQNRLNLIARNAGSRRSGVLSALSEIFSLRDFRGGYATGYTPPVYVPSSYSAGSYNNYYGHRVPHQGYGNYSGYSGFSGYAGAPVRGGTVIEKTF